MLLESTNLPPYALPAWSGVAGVARCDITPPAGINARNWGAAAHDTAEGVHRPLTLTVLTLQETQDSPPFVLASADLGWWRRRHDEWRMRGGVTEALGLDRAAVMLCLTHTHAGPLLCPGDAHQPGGHHVRPYLEHLRAVMIEATERALASAAPATLTWSYGRCGLAANRDLPDPNSDRWLCGFNPARPADDTLLVGRVTHATTGEITATLVNYACHPTTLAWENRLLSPDYIGAMRETVEAHTGHAPCLFLLGACGELAPAEQYTADTTVADQHGRRVGYAVLSTLEGMGPPATRLEYRGAVESGAPLAVWGRAPFQPDTTLRAVRVDVELPIKEDWPTEFQIAAELETCHDAALSERLTRKLRVRQAVGNGPTVNMPLWAWRVGAAVMVGQRNEAYSLFQTELRRRFPGRALAAMNVVNGHIGYLPPRELYGEDLYAVWQTPFADGSLEILIEAAEAAVRSLL